LNLFFVGGSIMSRSLTISQPKAAAIHQLHKRLEEQLDLGQRRRAEAILLYATGINAVEIAQVLEVHRNTIYADLHAFEQNGMACLDQLHSAGAPLRIGEAQRVEILRLAELPPYELGLPYGRWSVAKLRDYLLKQRVVKAISGEPLRRSLKKGASASVGSGTRSSATTRIGWPFWAVSA
jgi:transposase